MTGFGGTGCEGERGSDEVVEGRRRNFNAPRRPFFVVVPAPNIPPSVACFPAQSRGRVFFQSSRTRVTNESVSATTAKTIVVSTVLSL